MSTYGSKAYEMKAETLLSETKLQQIYSAMSNMCRKLCSSTDTAMAVTKHQLRITTDGTRKHRLIWFIFSKPQREKRTFNKVSKHITF